MRQVFSRGDPGAGDEVVHGALDHTQGTPELQGCRRQIGSENPLWGFERIRGELLKLGLRVSSTSVRNLLRRYRIPPAPLRAGLTWRRFLQAHGRAILACDYFTVDTVFLKRL